MSASATSVVLPSLAGQPFVNYSKWLRESRSLLASHMKMYNPRGFLIYEFDLPAGEQSQDKPEPPEHPHVDGAGANTTNMAVEILRMKAAKALAYYTAEEIIRNALIESLGENIKIAMSDPQYGMANISIANIFTYVRVHYGSLDHASLHKINVDLNAAFSSTEAFAAEAPQKLFLMHQLRSAGQPVNSTDAVRIIRAACSPHFALNRAAEHYCEKVPGVLDQQAADMVAHITRLHPTYQSVGPAGFVGGATKLYTYEEALELKRRPKEHNHPRATACMGGKGSKYCYVHGKNNTHLGSACYVMKDPKNGYTQAQRDTTLP